MNYEKLLGDSYKGVEGLGAHRDGFLAMNPFQSYQPVSKFPPQYQFPSTSIGSNPFMVNDGLTLNNNNGFGYKFAHEPSFGHSALETQSQYGPPQMQSKGGKLKGAALSALTLLAFLFFLNLLQSCLKEQMDTMNPMVMVMSAGQRTYLTERNDALNEEQKAERLDKLTSDEHMADDDQLRRDYESDEYSSFYQTPEKEEPTPKPARKRTKAKTKRQKYRTTKHRLTQMPVIEPKLDKSASFRDKRSPHF